MTTTPAGLYPVLGSWIREVDAAGAVALLAARVLEGRPAHVCFVNVHSVMEARRDAAMRRALDAGIAFPDGIPIVWMGRLQGRHGVGRVYGPDITLDFCAWAARAGRRGYLYGGAAGVPEDLAHRLTGRFPGLRIVGVESPPFRELSPSEEAEAIARINASGADFVLVGLGCPKQEKWMARHREALAPTLLLGVGAAFDFHTGRVPQAPRWVMAAGLEWLYRLAREPRRLWRRYILNNPGFLMLAAFQLLCQRLRRTAGAAETPPPA